MLVHFVHSRENQIPREDGGLSVTTTLPFPVRDVVGITGEKWRLAAISPNS